MGRPPTLSRARVKQWLAAFNRRRAAAWAFALGAAFALCFAALVIWVPLPAGLRVKDSVVVTWRDHNPAHVFLSQDDKWRIATKPNDVSPAYIDALVAFEDQRFWSHPGVDLVAIARAAISNLTAGRIVSGASTLTMQVVRLLEPRPRTLRSKVIEAFRAVQLEVYLSKTDILSQYLRLAPFGGNIEGVQAASWSYFGHSAAELTAEEIAVLLAVPQSPTARAPSKANHGRLRAARDSIAQRLLDQGLLPRGEGVGHVQASQLYQDIVAADVPHTLNPFPREIPHAAYWLRAAYPGRAVIVTTLDAATQHVVEHQVARRRAEAKRLGIQNATVVVVDHATVEARALVGNFDFDLSPGAQIPGFAVQRSPGSLLKPFITAAAIDAGLVLPGFLVADIPFQSGSYAPENYDGKFSGLVRLEDALTKSLNIPFVMLLRDIGVETFTAMLRAMGAQHLSGMPGWYGLTAAVGGVELTAIEVAGMYATLARGGESRVVKVVDEDPQDLRVFSQGATWLVRHILEVRERPDFAARRLVNPFGARVFWKTGTSFGNLDAWAVGAGESMTVAVWMGNQSRVSSSALVGSQRCAPLLFDILEAIEHHGSALQRPDDLVEVEVCAYSGMIPTDACEHTTKTWALKSHVPTQRCSFHVRADVDVESGLVLTPSCRADREYTSEVFLQWPAAVRRYLTDRHRAGRERPAFAQGCRPANQSGPPNIVSPPAGRTLNLRPSIPVTDQQVPFEADAQDSSMILNWYVDGEHLDSAPAGARVWWTPELGEHEIVVMDENGRSVRRRVDVH